MKNTLLFFIVCFLSCSVFAADNAATGNEAAAATDTDKSVEGLTEHKTTEAQAGCLTPECLGTGDNLGSPDLEVAELCRYTLPEHCQKIKDIKFTTCYDDQAEWGGATGASALACVFGLAQGAVDIGSGIWNAIKGTYKFAVDSEYRDEAFTTMSYLSEQFSDSEKAKAFLTDPLLEDVDEWVQCFKLQRPVGVCV